MKYTSVTTFYIVRHGETDWNVEHRLQGHADRSLTENGIKQAQALAQELKVIQFDEIFSSDLMRAKRTAEIVALERNMLVKTTQQLREKHYGTLEGITSLEMKKLYKNWNELTEKEKWHVRIADDETNEEAVTRFMTFLRETAITFPNKTILIATHGGMIRNFLIKLALGDFDRIGGIINCGYIKVSSDGLDFNVLEVKGLKTGEEKK